MSSIFSALLQGGAAPGPGGGLSTFMLPVIVLGVMYFLVIRPQNKKAKQQALMISQLKRGDDVVTSGGLIGRITGIKDDEVTLQVQEGVRFRVLRSSVTGLYRPAVEPAKSDAKASVSP
ncbi:MAG TPA: preprotein translocase subunit YajC [Polyangia bacterium]